ncbi:hypothetical protein KC19_2G010500 [Ceratodon purpureus]|uniref:Pentacotripeptide-repeat region of PRORP domain-containing protein n=1 Tax=Ceratodon purpureus TaxID=3225 RepID=A0A8T0IQX7_CERPU|nr:hypothetical protein KC19_2G010500 [Ceratodon purpureus]
MWLAGMQACLRQTHSCLREILLEGPRAGGGGVNRGLIVLQFQNTVATWSTASSRNSSSEISHDAGNSGRNYKHNNKSHAVIVAQFEELLQEWGSKTPQLLDALQVELKPMIVCRVLKKMPNPKVARKFFKWAGSKKGYQHNMYTYTALIDHYGRAKNFEAIEEVLAEMCEVGCGMSIVTFSSVMHWYREAKNLAGVHRVWEHMQREGCRPNEYTYTTYIDALAKNGCHKEALEVFKEMQDSGCDPNMFTYNVLIHSLVKAGKLDGACEMFKKLLELEQRPNFVTYTILVSAHAKSGDFDNAIHFFKKMMEAGFVPSHALRSLLFTALTTKDRAAEVAELTQMCTDMGARIDKRKSKPEGVHEKPPTPVKLAELLIRWGPATERALEALTPNLPSQYLSNVFANLSSYPEVVWRFFKWLKSQEAHEPSKYVFSKVMDILGKSGHVDMQLEVLADAEASKVANSVMYNTLIHSYCTGKQTDAALEIFENMKERGHKPNAHTYTMLIDLLSRTRNHAQAMKMYGAMVKADCKPSMHTYTVVIQSLARSGKVNAANTLFERLPSLGIAPSAVTYTVLIQAFLREKDIERALELYEAMTSNGIIASRVTLRVLTRGLKAAGMHDKAELLSREQPAFQGLVKGGRSHRHMEVQKDVQAILLQSLS